MLQAVAPIIRALFGAQKQERESAMEITKGLLNSGYVEVYMEYGHKDVYKQAMDREPLTVGCTVEEVLDQVFAYADRFTDLARFLYEDSVDGIWFTVEVCLPRQIGWARLDWGTLAAFSPRMEFLENGLLVVPNRARGWRPRDWGFDDKRVNAMAQKELERALQGRL